MQLTVTTEIQASPAPRRELPTLLLAGSGEAMAEAIASACDRRAWRVETCPGAILTEAVHRCAPDLVVLVGDTAANGGAAALRILASDSTAAVVPVAVVSDEPELDARLHVYRYGAVAAWPREAGPDAIARRIGDLLSELPGRTGHSSGALDEAALKGLAEVIEQQTRTGILSVAQKGASDAPPLSFRLVLGAGERAEDARQQFVGRLTPLIESGVPLRYDFHEMRPGRLGVLERRSTSEGADLRVLRDLRVVVVEDDERRAGPLARELRAGGATVVVTEGGAHGLPRARRLDPDVVIVRRSHLDGAGGEILAHLRADPRLCWTALLVADWRDVWPDPTRAPDIRLLSAQVAPLVASGEALRQLAGRERTFETRLEVTGPSQLLRVLGSTGHPLHVQVSSPRLRVEFDLAEGLLVACSGLLRDTGEALEGPKAVGAFLRLPSGRVRVERAEQPKAANLMAPVEEAIARSASEIPPFKPSPLPSPATHEQPPEAPAALGGLWSSSLPPSRAHQPLSKERAQTILGIPAPPLRGSATAAYRPPSPSPGLNPGPVARRTMSVPPPVPVTGLAGLYGRPFEAQGPSDAAGPSNPPPVVPAESLGLGAEPEAPKPAAEPPRSGDPEPEALPKTSSEAGLAESAVSPSPAAGRLRLWGTVGVAAIGVFLVGGLAAGWLLRAQLGLSEPTPGAEPRQAPVRSLPATANSDPSPPATAGSARSSATSEADLAPGAKPARPTPTPAEGVSTPKPAPDRDRPAPPTQAPTAGSPERAAVTLSEEDRTLLEGDSVDALVSRGERLLRDEAAAAAGRFFAKAHELAPRDNHALAGLAGVALAEGRAVDAIRWAEAAVRRRSKRAPYRVLLGDAHRMAGNLEAARAAYKKALKLDATNRRARRRLRDLANVR